MTDHAQILKMLFPLELGDNFAADVEIEGEHLDAAEGEIDLLIENMFTDTAGLLLEAWERVLDITPGVGETVAARQAECTARMRARGGLSKAYYESLAARYGCSIVIVEYRTFQTGRNKIGDRLYKKNIKWCWEVRITDLGEGEPAKLQKMIQRLKPAHTFVWFT